MNLQCIIVDDEPLALGVLENYISALPNLVLSRTCSSAIDALTYLHEHHVDLMFLDIKMPELTGLDMLKALPDPPAVIITTAYSEYALEGYEFSVADYLLKPFSFERFLKAVTKVVPKRVSETRSESSRQESPPIDYIFFKVDRVQQKVRYSEILYIEGFGNFIKIFVEGNRMLLVTETLKNISRKLPSHLFVRTHKSYIVSIRNISQVSSRDVAIAGKRIPIGNLYRKAVEEALKPRT